MEISPENAKKMQRLAQEGKSISKIREQDFPSFDYWDVYIAVNGGGEKSSQGVKKMITNRLNKLIDANKEDRKAIVDEIKELVWHLYNSHKKNTDKLSKIRSALD